MNLSRPARSLPIGSLVALLATGAWAGAPRAAATDPAATAPATAAGSSASTAAPAVPYADRSEDEVLLMGLRLRYQELSDAFPVFPLKDGYLVPLGALCHALDLGIRVDPYRATADGFVISESRTFSLDVGRQRILVGGKALNFIPGEVEVHSDDIYVDTRLLSQWLPLDFKVDHLNATLTVIPTEPLPIEDAKTRSRSFGAASQHREDRRKYVDLSDPYRWAEVPMVDETLNFSYAKSGTPAFQASSSTFAAGDFLKMTGKLYFNVGQNGETIVRGSLGRTNPDPVLLGPLHAREFELGDVVDPGLSMVSVPTAGSGAMVTNFPANAWIQDQKRTFRGDLPPGWQVELYQNGALIGLQTSQADGTYEFRDVSMIFGWNDFRLAFYGPQGQRRDERFHVDAEQPLAPAGEFRYLAMADQPYELHGGRGQLLGAYGFTPGLSGFAAVSSVDLPGSSERYGVAGLQGNWDIFTARITGTAQQGGGSAEELSLSSRLGGVSIQVKRDELQDNFFSEVFLPSPTFIKSRTSLDLSGALPSMEHPWVTVGLGAQRDEFINGGTQDRLIPRLGFSIAGWYLNDFTVIQRNAFPDSATSTSINGDFLASRRLGSWGFRGDATYSLDSAQGRKLQSLAAYVDTTRFQPWTFQAGLLHSVQGGGNTILGSATKTFGHIGISVNASWSSQSQWTGTVALRVNLAREPRSGSWEALAQASALQGAASGLAFIDANANKVKDPGEAPIPNAGFLLNGMPQAARTDANGVSFMRNLPTDTYVRIAAAQQSLDDPFMQAPADGWRILPRPGHTTLLGAAVVMTGDINGTIYQAGPNGAKNILAGVGVELVDEKGTVVAQTRSGYDGYYDMGSLKPGSFQLRLSTTDLKTLGLVIPQQKPVALLPVGTELDGLDWILQPIAQAPAPAPAPAAEAPAVLVPLPPKIVLDEATLHFAPGKALLNTAGKLAVDEVAAKLIAFPGPYTLLVAGFSDTLGGKLFNQKLSKRRADAIAAELIAAGVPADRVKTAGKGPVDPIADNKTAEGRSHNRRVEVNIQTPDANVETNQLKTGTQKAPEGRKGARRKKTAAFESTEDGLSVVSVAQLRAIVLHGDPKVAAQLSLAWLRHADLTGWAVRAQLGALSTTLLEASEYLKPTDGAVLLRPWALANGQCAREFFVAGFRTKVAAQGYAHRLLAHKELDPATVVPVKELVNEAPPCGFYAD